MARRGGLWLVLLAWTLTHSGRDGRWQQLGDFEGPVTCDRVLDSHVGDDVRREIGSALADLPTDNPIRQQAWERAERRVRERYRCEWREG